MNRKALSPLVATILLIAFAITLGAVIMSVGKSYVVEMPSEVSAGSRVCDPAAVTDPLKLLQIQYVNGEIDIDAYLAGEKALVPS